jgi:hypothetical protein
MDFIHRVFENDVDDYVHGKFIRFGKGTYEGKAIINLMKGKQIKISSSFEYGNDYFFLLCNLSDLLEFDGVVLSKDPIESGILKNGKKKAGGWVYEIKGEYSCEEISKVLSECYYILTNVNGDGIEFKAKKKLPKPGKDAAKTDDKFFSLKADLKHWPIIYRGFFSDLPENVKKAKIRHTFIIDSIVMPPSETDPAKIREMAKRKGKIIRELEIDGNSKTIEKEFEV